MAVARLTKAQRRAILDARNLVADIERRDANEAETRRRVERIFAGVMGYDVLAHLSRERAVHGAGDTEHVDFAIQLDSGPDAPPLIMVELKRVGVDLSPKHLKQASRYAIDAACEWVLLTNGRDWQLYHVEFSKPPRTKLVEQWDLMHDEISILARKFDLISLKRLKRGVLDTLWERTKVLAPQSLLKAILSAKCINALRRVLRDETGVKVTADNIVAGLRKMLNENAAAILENVEVSLPKATAAKPARRSTRGQRRPNLAELVNAGAIPAGTTVFAEYKGSRYEASVQGNGTLLFEGKPYKKIGGASAAVTSKHGPALAYGWQFWKTRTPDGAVKTLRTIRQEHAADEAPLPGADDPC